MAEDLVEEDLGAAEEEMEVAEEALMTNIITENPRPETFTIRKDILDMIEMIEGISNSRATIIIIKTI